MIVPVRGEAPPDGAFLAAIREGGDVELLVTAEARRPEATFDAFEAAGARLVIREGPRGERLAAAAKIAKGEILLFLHADTRLPPGWAQAVNEAVAQGAVGGAFRLSFQTGGRNLRLLWVAFWANRRTSFTRVPYGDQAPFVRADVYKRLGGHKPWPLLEDVDFGTRLRDAGRIALLEPAVETSPRRYLDRGVLRTVLSNWKTLVRFALGASPETLAEDYRR